MEKMKLSAVLLLLLLISAASTVEAASKKSRKPEKQVQQCAKKCHEDNCDNVSLRYGKYCGVGHGGCPGQAPCDAADACCKAHDECVGKQGVLASSCHQDFIACLDEVMLSGSKGFSKKCPYSLVIPTMQNGIQLTMMLGGAFGDMLGGSAT